MANLLRGTRFYGLEGQGNLLEHSTQTVKTEYRMCGPSFRSSFHPLICLASQLDEAARLARLGCMEETRYISQGGVQLFISIGLRITKAPFSLLPQQ